MERIIELAIGRLRTQGMTPLSPCAVDADGRVRMCTAAAVAAAGLAQRFGAEASQEFERQLPGRHRRDPLYTAFDRLALPRSLCDAMRIYNDSVAAERRLDAVVEFLAERPALG